VLTEKFEPENYTGEARHHMLEESEQDVNDQADIMAYENRKEATKLLQKRSSEEKSGK